MIPQTFTDEDTPENDVRYRIADCRKRLRSQRATLRTSHHSPEVVTNGVNKTEASIESYAEMLTVSMSQGSLSRLVECLLGPSDVKVVDSETATEQEEAVIT